MLDQFFGLGTRAFFQFVSDLCILTFWCILIWRQNVFKLQTAINHQFEKKEFVPYKQHSQACDKGEILRLNLEKGIFNGVWMETGSNIFHPIWLLIFQ